MYIIRKLDKKKIDWASLDFQFEHLEDFYEVAQNLTVPLFGKYKISVVIRNYEEIKDFKFNAEKYESLDIMLLCTKELLDYISLRDMEANIEDNLSMFTVFKEMIGRKQLLMEPNVVSVLYNSIGHTPEEMEEALMQIKMEYDEIGTNITVKMLEKMFIINDAIYPRTVAIEFINQRPYRWNTLDRLLKDWNNDLVVGSIVKNVKKFMEQKAAYYKSGDTNGLIRILNTKNLIWMYQVFVTDRTDINDIKLLFHLYENGITREIENRE